MLRDPELLRDALLIRRVEETLLDLFSRGEVNGTIHTCIGQELTGLAVKRAAGRQDALFSNHRCHGHFIAWTGDAGGLIAEVMGRESGACGGLGGSQHIHGRNFFSSGVQGGMVPAAAGWAWAAKAKATGGIAISFIGDGTLGQGILYETLNIASRYALPLLVIVENNRIAQSTRTADTTAGTIEGRAAAFGLPYGRAATWDWGDLLGAITGAVERVRSESSPFLLEVETDRLRAHSKGDDTRPSDELSYYEQRDLLTQALAAASPEVEELRSQVEALVIQHVDRARETPPPADVASGRGEARSVKGSLCWEPLLFVKERVGTLIYQALRRAMERDDALLLLGEDIEAAYGGAFRITRDLSTLFPGRVTNMPISEAAIVGVANGLALGGLKPVAEIMFGDFLLLAADQLLNHTAKFRSMYGERVKVPVVIRTPMGGRRGYGPTHSQSLEKHFLGAPGLTVLALNGRLSPTLVYERLLEGFEEPTLVVENKVLYTRYLKTEEIDGFQALFSDDRYPVVRISPRGRSPHVTVFCYGGMLEEVEGAIEEAFDEDEILCEVICPTLIQPFDISPLLESATRTGKLLTVEEGPFFAALGSEAIAQLAEAGWRGRSVRRLGARTLIPSSHELECRLLPGRAQILDTLRAMHHE